MAKTPRDFGYRLPTWTQELLCLVLEKQTGIQVSCTTVCRLLKRNKVRLGRPKPVVGCPWKKARRRRRLREIQRLIANLPRGHVAVYVDDNVTRNHTCRTMPELMQEVYAYLLTRRRELRHQYARRAA